MGRKKIYRSDKNKVIAGVLGGLGEYFGLDPALLRLIWILVIVFTGFIPGIIVYFIAVAVMPKKKDTK